MSFPDTQEKINAAEVAVNQAFQQTAAAMGSLVQRINQLDTLAKTFEKQLTDKDAELVSLRETVTALQEANKAASQEVETLRKDKAALAVKVASMASHPDVVAAEIARIEQQELQLRQRKAELQTHAK